MRSKINMNENHFQLMHAPLRDGKAIEARSLEIVEQECAHIDRFSTFSDHEREVIKRMIHTTTCFSQVIESIRFMNDGVNGIAKLLSDGAVIITDTNMVRSGISQFYIDKWKNETVCLVSDPAVMEMAKSESTTRSHVAVREALLRFSDRPVILACGNAPTFLYSAVETIVKNEIDPSGIGVIAFPVGFVNVVEAKEYAMKFMDHFKSPGIVLEGRFGSSPLVVSAIHAIYRLTEN